MSGGPTPVGPDPSPLARRIDLAVLSPGTGRAEVRAACRDARELGCGAVCVAPAWVPEAASALRGSEVAVCGVVGFPLGATSVLAKVFEALECLKGGATELDVVIHVGAARSGDFRSLRTEATEIQRQTPEAVHKFIVEMALLPEPVLRRTVKAIAASRPAFLKTGTGTVGRPVSPADVALLRRLAPPAVRLKAAGGVRTREQAEALLQAGADRIGTSTARALLGDGG